MSTLSYPKLLITGVSGFLGWHLSQLAHQAGYRVYGAYNRQPIRIAGVETLQLDCTDRAAVIRLLDALQPDAVIHLAALSWPNACQRDPQTSWAMNVIATVELAQLCQDRQIRCVWTSSEAVFDGQHPPYTEASPVCPINIYGEHKARAEQDIQHHAPDTVICRMPLMFGAVPPTARSFLPEWLQSLRQEQPLKLFTDEYRLPVSAATATQGLLLALDRGTGLLHLSGNERVSRYEFGQLVAEIWQLPTTLLHGCSQADVQMAAPRPRDLHLDNTKARSLGYQPRSLRVELANLRRQL